jgi:2-iminoacetate synthase ThiH
MLKARKANRVLKIPDEKKKTYIALGYTITDMDGNMIHEHVEPSEKLEQAEKEIQDLKAQIASAGATEQAATPAPETKKTTKASSKAEK